LRYVTTGDGDVFDGTSNDVPFRARDDMCDTISRVDDSACERPVCCTVGCPGCGKGEHSLYSNVETLYIEGLEEDFGCLLSVFRRVKRRLSLRDKW
jgi:hypothetical protein